MTIYQGLLLGALQGLTEFLPVSSSGHLVLLPYFAHWPEPVLGFAIALHMGTLLALVAFFWRDLGAVLAAASHLGAKCGVRSAECSSSKLETRNSKLKGIGPATFWMIILGTLPAGAMGVALHDRFETLFGMPLAVAGFLALTAALLIVSECFGANKHSTADMRWWEALVVGFAQGCAIAPGLSRSGATIAAGLLFGFERTQATRFAFLLGIPAILGAGLLELPKAERFAPMWLLALGVSALFGYLAIRWVLAAVRGARLKYFGVYCLVAAAATVAYTVLA